MGNRREMEDTKSVPVGSHVAQNEPPIPSGPQTQPSEPVGDRITREGLKGLVVLVHENTREVAMVWWTGNRLTSQISVLHFPPAPSVTPNFSKPPVFTLLS